MKIKPNNPLLSHFLMLLLPDVFNHPVWQHFIGKHQTIPLNLIHDLQQHGEYVAASGDVASACQINLICAALQKQTHDFESALKTLALVFHLAEEKDYTQYALWSAWGSCALYLQLNRTADAIRQLNWIQNKLRESNEWVLADLLDLVMNALPDDNQEAELRDIITSLDHWGEELQFDTQKEATKGDQRSQFSLRSLPSKLHSLLSIAGQIITGKVRLQIVPRESPPSTSSVSQPQIQTTPAQRITNPAIKTVDEPEQYSNVEKLVPPAQELEPMALPAPVEDLPPIAPDQEEESDAQLEVYCLGVFRIVHRKQPIENWTSRKGLSIFKYLVSHSHTPVSKEILMDTFWPDATPESARNRLNVSMHSLRQALRTVLETPVILFETDNYVINPEVHLWVDLDEFEHHVRLARQLETANKISEAVSEMESAICLYGDDFLVEDHFEDWAATTRERLRVAYLDTLDRLSKIHFDQGQYNACVTLCQRILACDNCREDAHCLLMRCFSRLGQRNLALRQYQACLDALRTELDVEPETVTIQLAERIRRQEPV